MEPVKILIAEQEKTIVATLHMLLERCGHLVTASVTSGEAAVEEAALNPPDLILMDILLGGRIDGIRAVGMIRAQRDVPVIYLAADSDDESIARAGATDPAGYVRLPISDPELRAAVDSALLRHRMESRLAESESRYRLLAENSSDVIWTMTLDGRFTYVSPSVTALAGWTPEEAMGIPFEKYVPPAHAEFVLKELMDELGRPPAERSAHRTIQLQQYAKDGSVIDIEVTTSWLTDARGEIVGLQGSTRGIGERVRAERALRARDLQIQHIIEHSTDLFFMHDRDHVFGYVSPQSLSILGYTQEEMMRKWTEITTDNPVNLEGMALTEEALRTGRGQRPYELEVFHKNGERIWLEINESPLMDERGEVAGIVGAARDVSARARARENELRITAERDALIERLTLVMERMPMACVLHDADFNITYWNYGAERIFGWARVEVLGKNPYEIHIPPRAHEQVRAMQHKMRSGDMTAHLANENVTKDGRIIFCEWHNTPLLDRTGKFVGYLGMALDVTERRRAEQALARTMERYRRVVETSLEGIWMMDQDQVTTFVNPRMAEMLGYTIEEMIGRRVDSFMHPDDLEDHADKMGRRKRGENDIYERRFLRADGSVVYMRVSGRALMDRDGAFTGAFGMFTDLTEQKRAESGHEAALEVLKDSEERYRQLVELSPDGVCVTQNGRIVYLNPAGLAMVGAKNPGEILGMPLLDIIHEDYREISRERLEAVLEDGGRAQPFEEKLLRLDGTALDMEVVSARISYEGAPAILSIARDISRRKRAEELLSASEDRYRTYVEHSPIGIFVLDAHGRYIEVNPAACRMTGYNREELLSRSMPELLAPESRDAGVMKLIELRDRGGALGDFTFVRGDGSRVYLTVDAVRLTSDTYIGFSTDITERMHSQEELAKLSRAVEQSPSAIIITDAEGRIEYVNPRFTEITGYAVEEALGKNPRFLKSGHTTAEEYRDLWMTVLSGGTWQGTFRNRKKDGELFWESAIISPVKGPAGVITHLVALKEDVTERRRAEEVLVASLREKEIMLKEIHHRVKNNFQVIISMLNLQERTIKSAEVREHFADSRNRIRSMALIHEKLYQSGDLAHIDFGSYINSLAGELFKSSVTGGRVPLPCMECEPVHLTIEQAIPCGLVINELLTNVFKYAFPPHFEGRGSVRVSLRIEGERDVEIVIADNGVGLPGDVDLSKTNSLGLALVPLLVRQVEGTIDLDREGGTSYTIRFKRR